MAFSIDSLTNKFDALQETQDSIVSTSQWVLFYYRHADKIVEEWTSYVLKSPEKKKLAMLYLCNDVVQQARAKKRNEFVESFNRALPSALKEVHDSVSDLIRQKIVKIIKIWRDRKIFSNPVGIEGVDIGSALSSSSSRASASSKRADTPEEKLKALAATPQKFNTFWHETLLAAHSDSNEDHLDKLNKLTSVIEDTLVQLNDLKDNINNELTNLQEKTKSIEQKKLEIEERQRKVEEQKRAIEQKIIDDINRQEEENMLPTYQNDDSDSDSNESEREVEEEDIQQDTVERKENEPPKKKLRFADDE